MRVSVLTSQKLALPVSSHHIQQFKLWWGNFCLFLFVRAVSCSFVAVFPARDGNICLICAVPRLPKIKTARHLSDLVEPQLPTLPKFFQYFQRINIHFYNIGTLHSFRHIWGNIALFSLKFWASISIGFLSICTVASSCHSVSWCTKYDTVLIVLPCNCHL